jgi:thymidylate kinase
MIIEIFGPQGAGKTTFARALAARLQAQDQVVDLILSDRPAEFPRDDPRMNDAIRHRAAAMASRLARPVIELLTMTRHPSAYSSDVNTAANLLKALPPRNILWLIRLSQYLVRLSHSWQLASESDHIALFDQGFVQAVWSLVLFNGATDETLIARSVDAIPKPDMLIQLDAPEDILEARLRDRQRHQSLIERMLEIDPKTNSEGKRIFDQLHDLLRRREQPLTCVRSSDPALLAEAVNRIAEQVTAQRGTRPHKAHRIPENLFNERYRHV